MTKPARKKTAAEAPPFDPTPQATVATVTQSMELTVVQTAVANMSALETGLADLTARYKGVVYEVSTPEGMAAAKEARKAIATPRIALEKIRVAAKRPILDLQEKLDGTAREIKAKLEELEKPITEQIDAEERRIEALAEAAAQAEAKRVGDIQERIANIRGAVRVVSLCKTSAEVQAHMNDLVGISVDDSFAEFQEIASEALNDAITQARAMFQTLDQREADDRRRAAEQAEIDKARAEQAQRDREATARQEAERLRVDSIRQDIAELRGNRNLTPTSGADLIAGCIFDLENVPVTREKFAEFLDQAIDARAAGLAWLQELRTKALAFEAEDKRQAEQRELLAAQERDRQRGDAIRARIEYFTKATLGALRMQTAAEVGRALAQVQAQPITLELYEALIVDAQMAKDHAVEAITLQLTAINAREADLQLKLAREAAEQAERDRLEREEQERAAAAATEEAKRLERDGPPVDDTELEDVLAAADAYIADSELHGEGSHARVRWYLRRWCKAFSLQVSP